MKPKEVGFDGMVTLYGGGHSQIWKLARSMDENKGPDVWHTSPNFNINGTITNTFIWWDKDDPELYYRNIEGKLYKINFEPIEVIPQETD